MRIFDAHNHLHDVRLLPSRDRILNDLSAEPVAGMVINGTQRGDWDEVARLAAMIPGAIPAFGFHPWFLDDVPDRWSDELINYLKRYNGVVGEIGVDHWREGLDLTLQERMFRDQLDIARECDLPVTIHGLKAWAHLLKILRDSSPLPAGFLLHSYAGPAELIAPFSELGAYFSCSGAALHPKKERALNIFARVPQERLLIESDAPDQVPPPSDSSIELTEGATGARLTHPLTLKGTYVRVAELRGIAADELAQVVEENFLRLFGRFVTRAPRA